MAVPVTFRCLVTWIRCDGGAVVNELLRIVSPVNGPCARRDILSIGIESTTGSAELS